MEWILGPVLVAMIVGAFVGSLLRRQPPSRLRRNVAIAAIAWGALVIGLYALGGLVRPPSTNDELIPIESLSNR